MRHKRCMKTIGWSWRAPWITLKSQRSWRRWDTAPSGGQNLVTTRATRKRFAFPSSTFGIGNTVETNCAMFFFSNGISNFNNSSRIRAEESRILLILCCFISDSEGRWRRHHSCAAWKKPASRKFYTNHTTHEQHVGGTVQLPRLVCDPHGDRNNHTYNHSRWVSLQISSLDSTVCRITFCYWDSKHDFLYYPRYS